MRQRPPQPESPLVRLLRDPGGALTHALHVCVHALEQALPFIAAATGALLAFALALAEVRRRRGRRLAAGARLVRIAVPPELDPQAAELLWKARHERQRRRACVALGIRGLARLLRAAALRTRVAAARWQRGGRPAAVGAWPAGRTRPGRAGAGA